jgi:ABC-type uncharacterized transport system permease subunit
MTVLSGLRFRIEPRLEHSRLLRTASPAIAVALTVVVGGAMFAALGVDPLAALASFFIHPVDSVDGLGDLGVKAAPLLLCALGLAVGFRGNVWNIGAEGQLTIGAIAGGGVALAFHGIHGWYILPLMIAAAVAGGAAWAAIPAFLRTRLHANEILTSLMLTYVALQLLGHLVHGPWRSPEAFNFPVSRDFDADARLPHLFSTTELHLGVLFALLAVPVMWLLTERAYAGYQVRVAGLAPRAADYAGFKSDRIVWIGMLSGGALAGLAGLGEVAGPIGKLQDHISPGYGFAAIIVAFVGRLHPVGILFASLLMALLYLGGDTAQIELQIPPAVTGVFQGMLLFFLLGADLFVGYRIRRAPRVAA